MSLNYSLIPLLFRCSFSFSHKNTPSEKIFKRDKLRIFFINIAILFQIHTCLLKGRTTLNHKYVFKRMFCLMCRRLSLLTNCFKMQNSPSLIHKNLRFLFSTHLSVFRQSRRFFNSLSNSLHISGLRSSAKTQPTLQKPVGYTCFCFVV